MRHDQEEESQSQCGSLYCFWSEVLCFTILCQQQQISCQFAQGEWSLHVAYNLFCLLPLHPIYTFYVCGFFENEKYPL